MAAELARHGASCRIIDKNSGTTDQSRALVVHARTMEAFADMGIIDDALVRGHRTHGASIFADGERILHVTLDDLDTPYPFFLDLNQSDTEDILEQHLHALGVQVEWETELVALDPGEDAVRVRLRAADGAEEATAFPYIVACDGAHSFCRNALDLDFPGGVYPREFLLADVHVDWSQPPDEWYAYLSEKGLFFGAPLKEEGRWRLITERDVIGEESPNGVRATSEDDGRDEPTLDDLRAALQETAPADIEVHDPVWMSFFRVHHRLLNSLRQGRVFFAGDAAHLHTPLGGQGMNAGIQDAYNLAWKLALALHGTAPNALLDSYNAERRSADEAVVEGTDRLFRSVLLRKPVPRAIRDRAVQLLTAFESIRHRMQKRMAMLTVDYRESPIVGEDRAGFFQSEGPGDAIRGMRRWRDFGAGPEPGDRALDALLADGSSLFDVFHGTEHVLLLFAGARPDESTYRRLTAIGEQVASHPGAPVRIHPVVHSDTPPSMLAGDPTWSDELILDPTGEVHHRYGARADGLYLIRPDGYVGFRAQPARMDGLADHLRSLFTGLYPAAA
jgi:2-polyprenyl-6-methoxyphenol hydroxylase-like FAD-dependent oxidoreductase